MPLKQKSNFSAVPKVFFNLIAVFALLVSACARSPSATVTEAATATQKPTITIMLTPILRPTATETPVPTLTTDERLLRVKEWLATNADCRLPCWWGIEPDKVTWSAVNEYLNRIGAKSAVYEEEGVVIHETAGFDFDQEHVFNRVSFVETDAVISAIIVKGSGFNDSPNFKNTWTSFSPEQIIAEYGMPSRVWVWSRSLQRVGMRGPTMPYSIWLFYDHLGILVRYSGQVKYEPIYKMCPVFNEQGNLSDDMDMYLQAPGANTPLEDLPTVKNNTNHAISLEDAAGISLNEFYELFTKPDVAPCFETSRDIWR